MAEYIERESAIALIEEKQKELCPIGRWSRHSVYGPDREKFDSWDEIIDALNAIPAADVAPVVHGRWETVKTGSFMRHKCSVCGFHAGVGRKYNEFLHCPNCGAKMDGGEEDAAD